jgi:hypothetical protein
LADAACSGRHGQVGLSVDSLLCGFFGLFFTRGSMMLTCGSIIFHNQIFIVIFVTAIELTYRSAMFTNGSCGNPQVCRCAFLMSRGQRFRGVK